MPVTAIIAAGGRGTRFGGGTLKQLQVVGGRAILERSVAAFVNHPAIADVVVALPREIASDPPAYLRGGSKPLRVVAGGERRQDSVANAFGAADSKSDLIVIHDAARPFASADLIARTIAAASESGAAVAALQARDTVKVGELMVRRAHHERNDAPLILSSSKDEQPWVVTQTLPRASIFLAQTPQAFRRDVLEAALDYATREGVDATDEAALAERAGHVVRLVDGEASNIKITTIDDLIVAEAIAGGRAKPARTGRAGIGYDLHRLVDGRPLILGGVAIPSERGALGHSDADVVCHAVTDAVLGAACLGDIGTHFPDHDPRWQDASSLDLLRAAVSLVHAQGLEVGNVDITVILERPKIKAHVEAMRRAVAAVLGIEPDRVSIKGKTNEGVDAVGRGEAIAAHAIALLRSNA